MTPIFICDVRLLNVPSSDTLILVTSSAAVSDSAVRLRLRLTCGRHDYPSFPSDGCVRDELYLSFIFFRVPTAGQFHVKPTTTQQLVRLSHIILIASSQPAHICTAQLQSSHVKQSETISWQNSSTPPSAAAVIYPYVREH